MIIILILNAREKYAAHLDCY